MLTGITSWNLLCTAICTLSCLPMKNFKFSEAKRSFLVSLWSALESKVCDWNSKHHGTINKTTALQRKPLVFQHLPAAVNELNQLNFNKFKWCWERGLKPEISTHISAPLEMLKPWLSESIFQQMQRVWQHMESHPWVPTHREAQEMQNTLTLMEMHQWYQSHDGYKAVRNLPKAIS